MRSPGIITFTGIFFLSTLLVLGCQANCQPSSGPLGSLTEKEYRLVETSDPTVKNLTNTNFVTMIFHNNYTGEVHKVQDNNRFNNPALVFSFNIDPEQKKIKIQYTTPQQEGQDGAKTGGEPVGNPKTYNYTLGSELKLVDATSGFSYRFVPFEGIVKPDQKCTF